MGKVWVAGAQLRGTAKRFVAKLLSPIPLPARACVPAQQHLERHPTCLTGHTWVPPPAVRVMMKFCAAETSCGFFGSGGFIVYEIREGQDGFEVYELLPMLLIGVIGGLLGATFNHLNAKLARLRKLLLLTYGPKGRVVEGVVVAALTSTVSFVLPMLVACVVRGGGGGRGGGRQGPCEDSGGRDGKRGRAEVWMRGICITSPVVGGQFMLSAVRCFSVSCVTPDPPTPTHTHLHRPLPPPPPPHA